MIQNKQLFSTFLRYVSFNVFSMVGLSAYLLADTFFVANGIGVTALAALNIVLPVCSLVTATGLLLGMGASTRYAICKASGGDTACFSSAIYTAIAIGLALALAGGLYAYEICAFLGADTAVAALSAVYLKTYLFGAPLALVNSVLVCFVRNDGAPNLAMAAMVTGSLSNIVLDYVLVYPLAFGMFGAALATAVSPAVGLLLLFVHFIKGNNSFGLSLINGKAWAKDTIQSVAIGLPSFITEFSSGIIILVFNLALLNLSGDIAVAAYGIIANLALVATAVFNGIAQGIQPIISRYHGMGQEKTVCQIFRWAGGLAIFLGLLFWIGGTAFAPALVSAFNSEGNKEIAAIAARGIPVYFMAFTISGFNMVSISLFSSVAQPLRSGLLSAARGGLIIIPLVPALSASFGITGVWLSTPATEIITFVLAIVLLKGAYGQRASVIQAS